MAGLDTIFDDVIEENVIKPPIAVLKELAQELTKKTKGMLHGEIEQQIYSDRFSLDFFIEAPGLNNYRYHVFEIIHDLNFYPLEIRGQISKVANQDQLEEALKGIFISPEVKRVINGLLAQIKAA